ncbi:aminodeoxychorismate lyase [Streptomyces sp. F-3]|uniref:Endolytic murein transglycosylase n=1 Tax=Streptomyces thermogriseus TaxID=75292 RepID=A0ABP4DF15_9ACTN|nr:MULTISPECIES: endolytic transglycosylase MltG [Streptomyces]MDN5382721.1 endolytic transglycosylase MltG [Streptomyces sp. LB8]GAT81213.1 aminodeoxychorismate lyase [Streptomyces sp. F-3]
MQTNTPPRSTIRLTRRGRLALVVSGAVLAGTAVVVPLLTLDSDTAGGGPARPRTLVIPEGWRAGQVYAAIDKALALPPGTTKQSLAKAELKLPAAAGGNPEGYLFPSTYPVDDKTTPQSLLAAMVEKADKKFNAAPVAAGAQRTSMNTYQAVTIASIVQAESATKADMAKVARVVLNRLERGMPLQMDSILNYGLGRTAAARVNANDIQVDNPYNSYQRMGLPPTPIDNPGEDALRAVMNPAPGDWLYFVMVKPGDTRFTADYAEHQRNLAEAAAHRQSRSPQSAT